jgi:hypothetical protein
VHAMISPYSRSPGQTNRVPLPADLIPPKDKRTGRPDGADRREPEKEKEKDPGSAFGPESVPLATGSVSVVYWVPGPFPRPTPVQPDLRRRPLSPSPMPRRPRERLDADAPRHGIAPNLTSLSVRLASPVLD